MGDNRDGDEKWYKYRTQSFCANAAYSLFGIKKGDSTNVFSGKCSRKHFINSFFTYGGADNLLKMLGVEPEVYYSGYGNGQRELGNNDDAYSASNSNCVGIDDVPDDDDGEADADAEEQNGSRDRKLGSGGQDNQNGGYSSSLGCDVNGNYIIAAFQGGSCDGNYFLKSLDSFDSYNDQHNNIGCRSIWTDDGNEFYANNNYMATYTLLKKSWACDPRLYPNECPDPYGEKGRYEYAFRIAAHGGNGLRAYHNETLRRPLRIVSYVLFGLMLVVLILTYFIKNYRRIMKCERRVTAKGCERVVREDVAAGFLGLVATARACGEGMKKVTEADSLRAKAKGLGKRVGLRKRSGKDKRKKGRSYEEDDFHVVELAQTDSAGRADKRDKKKESVHVVEKVDGAGKDVGYSGADVKKLADRARERRRAKEASRSAHGSGEMQKSGASEIKGDSQMMEAGGTSTRGKLDPPDADYGGSSAREDTRAERRPDPSPSTNFRDEGDRQALKAQPKAVRMSEQEKDEDLQMVLSENGTIKKIESPRSKAKAKAKNTHDAPFECKDEDVDNSYQILKTVDGKEGVLL
jgi:hypothetical protein